MVSRWSGSLWVVIRFAETKRTTGSINTIVATEDTYLDDANLVGHVERIVVGGQAHVRLLAAVGPGEGEGGGKGKRGEG